MYINFWENVLSLCASILFTKNTFYTYLTCPLCPTRFCLLTLLLSSAHKSFIDGIKIWLT